jgi:SAM-dependent methyltransferase
MSLADDADIPSPIDFHDLAQARAWVEDTVRRRPARPAFFAAFCSALSRNGTTPLDVLELGAGPGHLAREVVSRCAIRRYVALDFSEAMHQLAREHLGELAARVTFETRDFRDPRWTHGLGSFDAVVTMQAAHEMRHKRHLVPLLERARSVLKPDGVLGYCDHYADGTPGKNAALYAARDEQPAALREAGFKVIKPLHEEGGMALYSASVANDYL